MQFKGAVLREQFVSDQVNRYLKVATWIIDAYIREVLKKDMVVTSVLRHPDVQVDSCKKFRYKSCFEHCAGMAVDIWVRNLTEEEIKEILGFVQGTFRDFCSLRYHLKTAPHFHLTLSRNSKYRDQDKICKIVENTKGASRWFAG